MSPKSWDFDHNHSALKLLESIRNKTGEDPFDLAIILGSGWAAESLYSTLLTEYKYADWDFLPKGQIKGHLGRLLVVKIAGWRVLLFCGRFHCYQGFTAFDVTVQVRLARQLGCPRLLLTCATGGINPDLAPGDVLMVEDHLNLIGDNPLVGLTDNPFVDLTGLYSTALYNLLKDATTAMPFTLHRGVLAAMSGPSYETPAEIRMLGTLGADVVSMSTVPEAIMGRYLNMEVIALAMITNVAAGLGSLPISHTEVLAKGATAKVYLSSFLNCLIDAWQKIT